MSDCERCIRLKRSNKHWREQTRLFKTKYFQVLSLIVTLKKRGASVNNNNGDTVEIMLNGKKIGGFALVFGYGEPFASHLYEYGKELQDYTDEELRDL